MSSAVEARAYYARRRRLSLADPAARLFRTNTFIDNIVTAQFSSLVLPVTFAIDFKITGTAPNGCLFEVGDATTGAILWVDSNLGTMGFAAGDGTGAANNGTSGTVPLNHLGASAAVVSAGGVNYAVGDLITLTGGTFSQAVILRVETLAGSAVATVSIINHGAYSKAPANPVAQGSTTGVGTGATFTMTFVLTGGGLRKVVCAANPGDGTIRAWVNGSLKIAAIAAGGSFPNGWSDALNGWVGAVSGTANDRAPAGARANVSDLSIIGPLSAYTRQRPRQYYTGRLA